MAAVAQGSRYLTADLDLCYARDRENYQRLAEALAPLHPQLRGAPPDLPLAWDERTVRGGLDFTVTTDAGPIDLLGEVIGLGGYIDVMRQSEVVELFGDPCWVLTLDRLIRAKQVAGRPKDLMLVPELEALRALREQDLEGQSDSESSQD